MSDQTPIIRFIEDNWQTGRIGDYSFDALAGDLRSMFDFGKKSIAPPLYLDPPTGEVMHAQD